MQVFQEFAEKKFVNSRNTEIVLEFRYNFRNYHPPVLPALNISITYPTCISKIGMALVEKQN